MLDPLNPYQFVTLVSAFKFDYPVNSFYPKVSPLLIAILPLSPGPCWNVTVDSRDNTCRHKKLDSDASEVQDDF